MVTQRDIMLYHIAREYGLDSFDLEDICARRGLDVYSDDLDTVLRVLADELAERPTVGWRPWEHPRWA